RSVSTLISASRFVFLSLVRNSSSPVPASFCEPYWRRMPSPFEMTSKYHAVLFSPCHVHVRFLICRVRLLSSNSLPSRTLSVPAETMLTAVDARPHWADQEHGVERGVRQAHPGSGSTYAYVD